MNPSLRRRLVAASLIAALASPAAASVPAPSLSPLLFGNESAAYPEGPAALLFNPAASGIRYPSEFALTMLDPKAGDDAWRGSFAIRGF